MAHPDGHYWDGGIIDYHFDFANCAGDGLVLYPHFSDQVVTGWFDKALSWRRNSQRNSNGRPALDNVVIVAPSQAYIAALPYGKIPDRSDFQKNVSGNATDLLARMPFLYKPNIGGCICRGD